MISKLKIKEFLKNILYNIIDEKFVKLEPKILEMFIILLEKIYIIDDIYMFGDIKEKETFCEECIEERLNHLLDNSPIANGLYRKYNEKKDPYFYYMLKILFLYTIFNKKSKAELELLKMTDEKNCNYMINTVIKNLSYLNKNIGRIYTHSKTHLYAALLDENGDIIPASMKTKDGVRTSTLKITGHCDICAA